MKGNMVIAQSGGPTAVVNASIVGAIKEATQHEEIEEIFGALNGIEGVLKEKIWDLRKEKVETLERIKKTPSSALGSSRYKLGEDEYERIIEIFNKYNIRYFFYTGGNDSMDTADKISKLAQNENYPLVVIGIPKTVDNDLAGTDHCPGYGSVARWLAMATRDAGLDTEAIYKPDTIKIIETMGRNTGWITAATALARERRNDAPNLIYLPERPFIKDKFLEDVDSVYRGLGHVVISVCEGLSDEAGNPLVASEKQVDIDAFGHKQLGGVADYLCRIISDELYLKARYDKPGTIQRVSMLCVSEVDLEEAYLVGEMAVRYASEGKSDYMVSLIREPGDVYHCRTDLVPLEEVANKIKKVPDEFINENGNDATRKFIEYAKPLIGGSLPEYGRFEGYPLIMEG